MAASPYPTDHPLDGRRSPADAALGQALAEVAAQRRRVERLAEALRACLVRLDDLNEGDSATAQYARQTLRSIGQ